MLSEEGLKEIAEEALALSKSDQTEVVLVSYNSALTRFAKSEIHQNVSEENSVLKIRVVKGKRIGSASTNILSSDSIKRTIARAEEIAEHSRENADFVSLPEPTDIEPAKSFYKSTAECTPEKRAEDIHRIIGKADREGCDVAGAYSVSTSELFCANSLGIRAYAPFTQSSLIIVAEKESSSGYASAISQDIDKIDVEALSERAIKKCIESRNPRDIEPGEYEVILEPPAVSDLLFFMGYLGLGALSYQEKRSFMCEKLRKRVADPKITITDDGRSPEGLVVPFDFEGVPKQRVVLIEEGIARNIVYDSFTAHREKKRSTGHSLPQPNITGPIPTNLFLEKGDTSKEVMIKATKKGILVTRFHYTNVIDEKKCIITGMTRDGTFLIEDGRITCPIKNLRFTQSILSALSSVSMVSEDRELSAEGMVSEIPFSCLVPALKIERFCFSGKTDF
jgi:predicted Zn-dependent protease